MRAENDVDGLAVRFYDAISGGFHAPQEASYSVLNSDVIKLLDVPEGVQGSRGRYCFKFNL